MLVSHTWYAAIKNPGRCISWIVAREALACAWTIANTTEIKTGYPKEKRNTFVCFSYGRCNGSASECCSSYHRVFRVGNDNLCNFETFTLFVISPDKLRVIAASCEQLALLLLSLTILSVVAQCRHNISVILCVTIFVRWSYSLQ